MSGEITLKIPVKKLFGYSEKEIGFYFSNKAWFQTMIELDTITIDLTMQEHIDKLMHYAIIHYQERKKISKDISFNDFLKGFLSPLKSA